MYLFMYVGIAAPASCEVRAVILFLHAEGQSAAPHRGQHKSFNNQAYQQGDFPPPSLQSGPGTKRLISLHKDEGLVGYQALPHQRRARGLSQKLAA